MKKSTKSKVKTRWDLSLLYSSPNDPQIEKDATSIERAFKSFAKKYKNDKSYLKSETALLTALKDNEKLFKSIKDGRPSLYFAYRKELDGSENDSEAKMRLLDERFTKAANLVNFFELDLGKIPKEKQKKILKNPKLKMYHRYLEQIFDTSKYDLSEPEERILSLKSSVSSGMWVSGVDTSVNKLMVQHGKETIPLNKAINLVSSLKSQLDRVKLWNAITKALDTVGDFAESEINAVFTNKKINDELRGFKEPYEATILGYENDPRAVMDLIEIVSDKGFKISSRFYSLKKKILKLKKLTYADRSVSIGEVKKKFSFDDSVKIVRDAYGSKNKLYAEILDSYLRNGQIDVYPKQGKSGGAFCSSSYDNPTFVLLNHVDEPRSLMTLAHEMGHAIHAERAKTQPPLYQGHSIAVAETASTFFEGVVFENMLKEMTTKDKVIMLHDRIQDDISTIQRQIAFFNFELKLHNRIRSEGWVPKEEIAKMLNKETQKYLGDSVKLEDSDGMFFVAVGHFRNPFYVYSYAYGQLISKALLARVRSDPNYIEKVDQFLCAGNTKKPEEIFKDIGIKVDKKLFLDGLKSLEKDIDELEKLYKQI